MRKDVWLDELANFIVEANTKTWAADQGEVDPFLQGNKRHYYPRGEWALNDEFGGYFRAPGTTWVSYKGSTAWYMSYAGRGMVEEHYHRVKENFTILREALLLVTPDLPFRGPLFYKNGLWRYVFGMTGNIEDGSWEEYTLYNDKVTFAQKGNVGIKIGRTPIEKKPVYPWEL